MFKLLEILLSLNCPLRIGVLLQVGAPVGFSLKVKPLAFMDQSAIKECFKKIGVEFDGLFQIFETATESLCSRTSIVRIGSIQL